MTATGPALAPLAHPITAKWLVREGWRLDAAPYLSGKVEALQALEKLPAQRLADLTAGREGGIFNGPQFRRVYVDDPDQGVPFIGSSDMLLADLSRLPMLRKKDAESSRLSYLQLREGMTLISCSGTIGRTVYCRKEMEGMWSSQDVLKVVPDPDKIPPGYLFAFLKSRYGAPLVVSGTYGAIIQHIEPEHLCDIPIPRIKGENEWSIHVLVDKAGVLRTRAARLFSESMDTLPNELGLKPLTHQEAWSFGCSIVSCKEIENRWDAVYHSGVHHSALKSIMEGKEYLTVKDIAESVIEPLRFRRTPMTSGVSFMGTTALNQADPEISYYLPLRSETDSYRVDEKTVLLPRSGQIHGIIGQPSLPIGAALGGAVSEDAIRIFCPTPEVAGFLYLFLSSEYGRRQLKVRTFGTSIPHLDVDSISSVIVPRVSPEKMNNIGEIGQQIRELRHEAIQLEHSAIRRFEECIRQANEGYHG